MNYDLSIACYFFESKEKRKKEKSLLLYESRFIFNLKKIPNIFLFSLLYYTGSIKIKCHYPRFFRHDKDMIKIYPSLSYLLQRQPYYYYYCCCCCCCCCCCYYYYYYYFCLVTLWETLDIKI